MAKNITIMGASYSDVPAVQLPQTGGGTARFDDCTVTTATASDVAQGKVFVASDGTVTTGTASGGGSSAWTKVAETTYTVSTSSTTASDVGTWETGHSEIWTSDKILYIRIRDTAGKRNGYFYGLDTWFINMFPKNNDSSTTDTNTGLISHIWSVDSNGIYTYRYGYGGTNYGVYPLTIYSDGQIRFRKRYNSTYTRTVNSTYKVEVYLLDPAGGVPIFQ